MKKELPCWAILIIGLAFGLLLLAFGLYSDDAQSRRLGIGLGILVLVLNVYGCIKWAWDIHKRRLTFEDFNKSPEQINRDGEAALRQAADVLRKREHNDA
jgi:hypothetical protein